jgi:TolB-like protein/DNA-binding winged helix-turn-helix (wHTH) protein
MSNRPRRLYEFGPFVLNPAERSLLRDGEPVPLRPKVFDTLLVLVESHGHLVKKDELMGAVWPGQYVEEGNLNKNVSMLRQVLGEGVGGSKYIETVPKSGYRFVAEVRSSGPDGADADLVGETHARASLGAEEGADHEPSTADAVALAADVLVEEPTASTQVAGNFKRWPKSKAAIAAASAIIVTFSAVAYVFYSARSGEAIDSVAVLPFANESGDPEADYLSDGISDSIINRLSQLPRLRVVSLNSVLRYKGRQVDAQEVGRELNVRAVLVGRLVQRGDGLVVRTELVDVRDNRRLWGAQYSRRLSDILAVQGEIAGQIADKLRLKLSGAEKQRLDKYNTYSTEAYQAYLRGRYLLDKRTGQTTEKSIEYFEQAVRLDPNYALAYADLGFAYWSLGNLGGEQSHKEVDPRAEEAVAKALEIDDTLAEAYTSLGYIRVTEHDWAGAESAHRRAIELNPNSGYAHEGYAHYLRAVKRLDEAVVESKRAVELEPTSIIFNRDVGMMLYYARRYDETIEQCQKTLELDPNMETMYDWLARAYEQKGLYDQAVAAYLRDRELSNLSQEVAPLKEAYVASGWKGYWTKALDLIKERAAQRYVSPDEFAVIYAHLGENDQAFAWLEREYEERRWEITAINSDPVWDGLRSDPRYSGLVMRMGLRP